MHLNEQFRPIFWLWQLYTEHKTVNCCWVCDVLIKNIIKCILELLVHIVTFCMHVSVLTLRVLSISVTHTLSLLPSQPRLLCTLSRSLLSPVSVWVSWGKCAKLPYLGHTNNTSQFTWDSASANFDRIHSNRAIRVMTSSMWICHQIKWANCKTNIDVLTTKKLSGGFAVLLSIFMIPRNICKIRWSCSPWALLQKVQWVQGSIKVKVTWLFKKWQRELLILCTRTDIAAAVTFNGIIDCFRSTTIGFRFFCDCKSWIK